MAINLSASSNDKVAVHISAKFDSGEEAVRHVLNYKTDFALVNFNLPCMDGFECVRKLKTQLSDLPVLMFTTRMPTRLKDDGLFFSALHAGANGYLPGHLPPMEMLDAIYQVHNSVRRNRPLFLMFFESDRQLGCSAKHWEKIAAMLNASTATVSYGKDWRKVVMPFRKIVKKPHIHSLVPPVTISDRTFATI